LIAFINPTNPSLSKTMTCDSKIYKDKCIKEMPEGFTFLKSYTLDGQSGNKRKIEFSYIMSKGGKYMVQIASGHPQNKGTFVRIMDSNRREISGATSYQKGRYYPGIQYTCTATGIYYLEFNYNNEATAFCAGAVLSLKR
jgi:hypothetical protein